MNNIAIKVTNLTKTYKLYDKPIDRLKESLLPFTKNYHQNFYALNNINLEIRKGETVGIIGKNGAGKSTLLKILTGVLTPSSGAVQVNGKISSILELGAGFNPDYTGIENIYLHGSIMGHSKKEIDKKLESILDFADIGEFINQLVKSYSSGMFARLAFAVAINVEPDILIIDEALSVGDAKFQRKCFAKFEELQKKNTTILFVSHDLESIKTYTSRCLYIKEGMLKFSGLPQDATIKYLQDIFGKKSTNIKSQNEENSHKNIKNTISHTEIQLDKHNSKLNFGNGNADFEYLKIKGLSSNVFHGDENLEIEYKITWNIDMISQQFDINKYDKNLIVGLHLINTKGNTFFGLNTILNNIKIDPYKSNYANHIILFKMPSLISGDYFLTSAIAFGSHENHVQLCWYEDGIELKCISNKKHIIGFLDLPHTFKQTGEKH